MHNCEYFQLWEFFKSENNVYILNRPYVYFWKFAIFVISRVISQPLYGLYKKEYLMF